MIKVASMVGAPDLETETLAPFSGDFSLAFSKLSRMGYDGVEIMTKDPKQLDGEKIKHQLMSNDLDLVGLCTGHIYGEDKLGLVSSDPEVGRRAMIRLKEFVDFAASYFGEGTLINLGRSRGQGDPNDQSKNLDRMVEAFQELAEYAASYGIRWVLEPINRHQTNYIHTTQEGIEIVVRVNRPNFGLMLDVYHMNIEDDDIYKSFREAGNRCWFVHISDNHRRWPGSGHLNFEKIIRVLDEIDYDGYISMEMLTSPDPDTAATKAIEHLRRFIQPN